MTTTPDSQISSQTPKQDGVEAEKSSLHIPKQLRGTIPSVSQALPATPVPDHHGEYAAESNSAEDADTETETESVVLIQGQVQLQDQDQVVPSNLLTSELSKESLVREEDEKPSSDPEAVIEQGTEISHGPLTLNNSSDDDRAEHVEEDSLISDGQRLTQENNQNSDTTACRTQPKEPIKKNSLASVDAEEEVGEEEEVKKVVVVEEEDVKEADEDEEAEGEEEGEKEKEEEKVVAAVVEKEEEEEEEKEEEKVEAAVVEKEEEEEEEEEKEEEKAVVVVEKKEECPHHQGRVMIYCNVIGRTTGRPCKFLASQCPHHQGRVMSYCNVI
ncbi:hypothetical protein BGZ95_006345, partial [Linnemannia exigua]